MPSHWFMVNSNHHNTRPIHFGSSEQNQKMCFLLALQFSMSFIGLLLRQSEISHNKLIVYVAKTNVDRINVDRDGFACRLNLIKPLVSLWSKRAFFYPPFRTYFGLSIICVDEIRIHQHQEKKTPTRTKGKRKLRQTVHQ